MAAETILRQETGRFDHRFGIGPACWPFHDLLWIHSGEVQITIGEDKKRLHMVAPTGVLIFPDTPFLGHASSGAAEASVCHFIVPDTAKSGFALPLSEDTLHVQNLVQLSLAYARRTESDRLRINLLKVICDCFEARAPLSKSFRRLDKAWAEAYEKLAMMRSLQDVATLAGLSESSFRTIHRMEYPDSAGRHLQSMRFRKAEQLLSSTGLTVREVSKEVGYAHPESFTAAFSRSRGGTPAAFRKWCKRLA